MLEVAFELGLRGDGQRVEVVQEAGGAEEVDGILLVNEKRPRIGGAFED